MKAKVYFSLLYVSIIVLFLTGCVMVIKNSTFHYDKDQKLTTDKTVLINGIRVNKHKRIDTVEVDNE